MNTRRPQAYLPPFDKFILGLQLGPQLSPPKDCMILLGVDKDGPILREFIWKGHSRGRRDSYLRMMDLLQSNPANLRRSKKKRETQGRPAGSTSKGSLLVGISNA